MGAAETAKILGVSPPTLYQLARQRKIPHLRIGDRVLFDIDEILAASHVPAETEFKTLKIPASGGSR
jgi:excisionase family DNA binding protein